MTKFSQIGLGQVVEQAGGAPAAIAPRAHRLEVPELPSSHSVKAVLKGERGGWGKVLLSTTLRALLMTPGMWIVGVRGWKLLGGALAGSATITTFLFIFYAAKKEGAAEVPVAQLPSEVANAATVES